HAPTSTSTLSLHDALPIYPTQICTNYAMTAHCTTRPFDHDYTIDPSQKGMLVMWGVDLRKYGYSALDLNVHGLGSGFCSSTGNIDRKSTRLNFSHVKISYA